MKKQERKNEEKRKKIEERRANRKRSELATDVENDNVKKMETETDRVQSTPKRIAKAFVDTTKNAARMY